MAGARFEGAGPVYGCVEPLCGGECAGRGRVPQKCRCGTDRTGGKRMGTARVGVAEGARRDTGTGGRCSVRATVCVVLPNRPLPRPGNHTISPGPRPGPAPRMPVRARSRWGPLRRTPPHLTGCRPCRYVSAGTGRGASVSRGSAERFRGRTARGRSRRGGTLWDAGPAGACFVGPRPAQCFFSASPFFCGWAPAAASAAAGAGESSEPQPPWGAWPTPSFWSLARVAGS